MIYDIDDDNARNNKQVNCFFKYFQKHFLICPASWLQQSIQRAKQTLSD